MYWLLFFLCTVIFVTVKILKPQSKWKKQLVPYEDPWPVVGNMGSFAFAKSSLSEITKNGYDMFENKRYYCFYMFLKPMLVLRDIDLIKQTAIKDFDSFVDRRTFISENEDPLFGKSLFSLTGQKWKDMRSILSPAFSSSKMKSMFVLISECADQLVKHLKSKISEGDVMTLEMKDIFTRFATDVIATSAFGVKCDSLEERDNEFFVRGKECTDFDGINSLKIFGYTVSPEIMSLFKVKLFSQSVSDFFYNLVTSTIRVRNEKQIYRPDMIHLLMQAHKGNLKHDTTKTEDSSYATLEESDIDKRKQKEKPSWTDMDITSQALFFFFAGFETTSTLLCHMVNELAQNPDIQRRLQDEIDTVIEEQGETVSYDVLLKMRYLDMVVCETLRKWPPVPIVDRKCVKKFIIDPVLPGEKEVVIEKNDIIIYPIFGIQRDPRYYPDPDKFDPERFNDENKHKIRQFSYLPFGIGPRGCIGSRFALLEAKIVYFYLLSKFDFVVVKETQIPFKFKPLQFNLHAEKGYFVGLQMRNK